MVIVLNADGKITKVGIIDALYVSGRASAEMDSELYQQTEFHVIVKYFFHVRSYTHPKLYSQ